ncbi:MAG: aminopeptidase P family protein [Methanosarcinales archaeon]|nr:MAG: aminopeptidase P family protein [Methanosarcinales archaeon]
MTQNPTLIIDDSIHDQDLYYVTRFLAQDQFLYLNSGKREILLISQMELGRALNESRITDVRTTADYNIIEKSKRYGRETAYNLVVAELLHDEGITRIEVPHNFPLFLADDLRSRGIEVVPARGWISELRTVKTRGEIEQIRKAQECCEAAMKRAIDAIRSAGVRDRVLVDQVYSGDPVDSADLGPALTSERIRAVIEHTLIDCGCESCSTIVAGGKDGAEPHNMGAGMLKADESIVIDIFPRLEKERYYADMTRTVARGNPSQALIEMYEAVLDAQSAAIQVVRAGVSGDEVHGVVCDLFDDRGYRKLFPHSTGHGVGLDVHEAPAVASGGEVLKAGNVVTIEPGLYDPAVGGIRLEDLVVVTESGCENLTKMEKRFLV